MFFLICQTKIIGSNNIRNNQKVSWGDRECIFNYKEVIITIDDFLFWYI